MFIDNSAPQAARLTALASGNQYAPNVVMSMTRRANKSIVKIQQICSARSITKGEAVRKPRVAVARVK